MSIDPGNEKHRGGSPLEAQSVSWSDGVILVALGLK